MEANPRTIPHASLQQAAHWYVTLQDVDCSSALREEWQQWLELRSDHRAAWGYVERVGQRFAPLQTQALQVGQALRQQRVTDLSRRQATKALALLGFGSLVGLGGWRVAALEGWTADLASGTGERRQLRLQDGSELWLAARTAVDTRFTFDTRRLELRFGDIVLHTAAQDARPFVVHTECGDLDVAPGPAHMAINQQDGETQLNVYQGSVSVCTARSGVRQQVSAGQGVDFTPLTIGTPAPARAAAEAWTRGVLAAEAMPLSQLVDMLSRYRHGHLGYAPAVAHLSVMGTFPLNDTDQALTLLEAALPVRVRRLTDWWVNVEPA